MLHQTSAAGDDVQSFVRNRVLLGFVRVLMGVLGGQDRSSGTVCIK
jgi:hypothetical protein